MNILVIGATGPLGTRLVSSGLTARHTVSVLARNPASANFPPMVTRIQGDVLQQGSLDEAMRGQDAVISSLGSKISLKPLTLLSEGTRNIVSAMRTAGIRRFVCITGIGAGDSKGHGGFLYDRVIQPLLLSEVYKDKTRQEEIVRESGLDWTIVRPAQLVNAPAKGPGSYRVLSDLTGVTATKISREDVAQFCIGILTNRDSLYESLLLSY